jgi:hypothetical protein
MAVTGPACTRLNVATEATNVNGLESNSARANEASICWRTTRLIFESQHRPYFPSNRRQIGWSPGSFFLLLLALAVITWGTSYKLSLYKTSSAEGLTPAKLCTRASDIVKGQLDDATDGHNVLHHASLPNFVRVQVELAFPIFCRIAQDSLASEFSPLLEAPVLHLRPPPDRASLLP